MNAPTESAHLEPAVQPAATVAHSSIKDAVLAQFKDAEVIVIGLADKYRDVAFDVTTPKGMKEAIAARADLRDNGRLFVTKAETRIKADVNDLKRVMSSEVDRLVAIVKPVEDAVDAQIKAEEQRKAAEKAERDRIAAEKAAAHQAKIAKIRAAAENAKGISSERIKNGIAMVEGLAFGVECEDFLGQYEQAKDETLTSMRASLAEAQAREAAEAQRLENERVAAELAAQRAALEAQAAEIRRQAEAVETARVSKVHGIVFTFPDPEEEARAQREAQQAEASKNTEAQQPQQVVPKPAMSVKSHPIHGLSYTPEYRAWQAMRKRCTNPEHARWADYGGRGITVCDRWLNDVAAFVEDMGAKPSDSHELDRIDNDAGYSPDNCRWVLRSENNRNKSNNRIIEWNGEAKTMAEWCEITGLQFSTLKSRIDDLGWSLDRALTEGAATRGTAANESPRGGAMGAGQAAAAAPAGEPATLKLGTIGERLGFTLTEAFISDVLGIKPSGKDKRAVLYRESDFPRICDALVRHIQKAKAGELLAA